MEKLFFSQRNPFEEHRSVPLSECEFSFARSGGAGGQKVNKTSSKAIVRWNVGASRVFTEEEKQRIRESIGVNAADEVKMECDEERSQHQNRRIVKERLDARVTEVLKPVIARIATEPTRGSINRRLETKTRQSQLKRERRSQHDE